MQAWTRTVSLRNQKCTCPGINCVARVFPKPKILLKGIFPGLSYLPSRPANDGKKTKDIEFLSNVEHRRVILELPRQTTCHGVQRLLIDIT